MTLFAHAAPTEWPQAALQFGPILPGSDRLSMIQRGSNRAFPKSIGGEPFSLYQEAQYTLLAR